MGDLIQGRSWTFDDGIRVKSSIGESPSHLEMTKDLALLVGPDHLWPAMNRFLRKLDEDLKAELGSCTP